MWLAVAALSGGAVRSRVAVGGIARAWSVLYVAFSLRRRPVALARLGAIPSATDIAFPGLVWALPRQAV